jgi:hypothetical protein
MTALSPDVTKYELSLLAQANACAASDPDGARALRKLARTLFAAATEAPDAGDAPLPHQKVHPMPAPPSRPARSSRTPTETPDEMKARAHALRVEADRLGLCSTEGSKLLRESQDLYVAARELAEAGASSTPAMTTRAPARMVSATTGAGLVTARSEKQASAKRLMRQAMDRMVAQRSTVTAPREGGNTQRTKAPRVGTRLPQYVSWAQAAKILKLTPSQLAERIEDGHWTIPATMQRGVMVVPAAAVRAHAALARDYLQWRTERQGW